MGYIKLFSNTVDYQDYINDDPLLPNVSLVEENESIFYNPFVIDYSKEYMYVEALEDGLTVSFKDRGMFGVIAASNTLYYSKDKTTWKTLSPEDESTDPINAGEKMYIKGNCALSKLGVGIGFFIISKKCNVAGNVMSLLFGDDFVGKTDLTGYNRAFYKSFENCTTIQSAKNLILPATTLADSCYEHMFSGTNVLPDCSNIDFSSPAVVASGGLKYLFAGTKITDEDLFNILPVNENGKYYLPVTTLTEGCYNAMFQDCTNLTTAPELPATTLVGNCYNSMFKNCTSLTTAPELPATVLAYSCYGNMFNRCTNLTNAPELTATELADHCYQAMFSGCTSLTSIPELPATTLARDCYNAMFQDCTNLTTAPELPATTLANNCYMYMFKNCTSLTTAPELPATVLASYCYDGMFSGCTSLTTAPELPATTLVGNCYNSMFRGCTNLTDASELPATTLATSCYDGMFSGCTSLTTAPELPATVLASYCYNYMFSGCTSLNYIKMLATDISASNCLSNWVNGVSSTGTFVKNSAATWDVTGVNGIPEGWTVQVA